MGMCFACHGEFHDLKGKFRDFTHDSAREWMDKRILENHRAYAMAHPDMIGAPVREPRRTSKLSPRRSRVGDGWTVAGIIDLLKKQARISNGEVAAALHEIATLIERGKVH